jgi:hypothetical protein
LWWITRVEAGLARCLRRVLSDTLYTAAAHCWLNDASDFIALIARVILSVRGSNSRSCCCDIVRSGRRRCGLGKVRHFSGVRHSVGCAIQWGVTLHQINSTPSLCIPQECFRTTRGVAAACCTIWDLGMQAWLEPLTSHGYVRDCLRIFFGLLLRWLFLISIVQLSARDTANEIDLVCSHSNFPEAAALGKVPNMI